MMIGWNRKCDAPGGDKNLRIQESTMIGLQILFYAAGTDTSRGTSTSLIYNLGKYRKEQSEVVKEI